MKPYSTTVLEKIKNKSDDLKLRGLNDLPVMNITEGKIFLHIIERNKNGTLPTYNDLKNYPDIQPITSVSVRSNIKKLLNKELIVDPTVIEILQGKDNIKFMGEKIQQS